MSHGGGQFAHCRKALGSLQPFLIGLCLLEILQYYDVAGLATVAVAVVVAGAGAAVIV
ncbi:MAG: hypothetical protein BWY85_02322 [Firmicutes bacterium ADurb.Bin506]|nr:MAG: hypothetical protein BWY85_02322 [Firmicutes bacterium ADurb.Bin506]